MTENSEQTALLLAEATATGQALTITQQKKFVEAAVSTNLDKLNPEGQQAILIAFGRHTELRPELGEVMIYQGRIYITIAGMRRNAHKNSLFVGRRPRPATPMEKRNAGYEPDDIVWLCEIFRRGSEHPFVGWGKVTAVEVENARAVARERGKKPAPVGVHPVEIARKRAEYDGLRAAFPIDELLSPVSVRFIADAEATLEDKGPLPIADEEPPYSVVESSDEDAVGEDEDAVGEADAQLSEHAGKV